MANRHPGATPASAPGGERWQIGGWTVEPALNRISDAGTIVQLEPKSMSVLMLLADRPGHVVSREALLEAAWPGLVVGDDSLTQVILKLRKALGDAPQRPAYIETIAKRGYRIVARVRPLPQTPPEPATQALGQALGQGQASVAGPRGGRRAAALVALGVAGVVIVVAALATIAHDWTTDPLADPPATVGAVASALPTLAIAPFDALGDDPRVDVLARGMTADLLTDLSKLSGLSIVQGAADDTRPPMAEPAARYVVSGSVQRIDERIRLQVHLADARSGEQLWSGRFDRPLAGYFAIQDEVEPALLRTLHAKVSEAELRRLSRRYTRDLEAYGDFQRGQAALLARERDENARARDLYRHAIARDPGFARAYAGLALTYAADYRNRWSADGSAALDRALAMARTAYDMDPDIAETYWVMAFVQVERGRLEEALDTLRTALRLYPSYADGYALAGGIYTYLGRPAQTLPMLRTAMRLDPRAGYLYFLLLGRAYLFLGDLDQARVNLKHALLANPADVELHVYLATLDLAAGDKAAAQWEAEEIRAQSPDFSAGEWLRTYPMTDAAQRATLAQALRAIGLEEHPAIAARR
jgi:DNA-binding winged helix-turn-helix (wHTH) protein/TolB-like protein/Tfp pilus assembly protein PilF